jgi:group I intron endonuclease
MDCGVYQIKCLPTGQVYIGSTTNLSARWRNHRCLLNNNANKSPKLQAAWNTHGAGAFEFMVLERCDNTTDALIREQQWLDVTQAAVVGLNVSPTAGSATGVKRSKETRERMRNAQSYEQRSDQARRGHAGARARAGANLAKSIKARARPETT